MPEWAGEGALGRLSVLASEAAPIFCVRFSWVRVLLNVADMSDDGALLGEYVRSGSESAFGELVRRHLDLVYSAALRGLGGDQQLAQDVSQGVFMDLARKAASLSGRPS